MPEPTLATVVRWPVPLALAVPALAAAVAVTFTSGHSAAFGFVVFAAYALLTAVAAGVGAGILPSGLARTASILKAVVAGLGAIAAGVAMAFSVPSAATAQPDGPGSSSAAQVLVLALTIAATLALTAVVDLVVGIRRRAADRFARDWIATGVIGALGALAVVAVPPTFYQAFSFEEKTGEVISGAVTSSTMIVGLFGATAAILGVLLVISGIGLVPQRERSTERDRDERATA
ncbi:MAG: hypothetical protein J7480_00530 [Microbacteriaceae bacterium]|nr:hypothetical protein [Microbacteriaceae bacterium]